MTRSFIFSAGSRESSVANFEPPSAEQDPLNLMKHFQSEQQWVIGPHGHAD